MALAVAVLALVGWLGGLGFLADLLSKPVLIGYLAGVAVTMVVSQLPNITGITSDDSDTLERALDVARGSATSSSRRCCSVSRWSVRWFYCNTFRGSPVRSSWCSVRPW